MHVQCSRSRKTTATSQYSEIDVNSPYTQRRFPMAVKNYAANTLVHTNDALRINNKPSTLPSSAQSTKSSSLYSTDAIMPMIPLGLKETKEIDFRDPFKDFILEHYSEDANKYENAIADFMDTRQVIAAPLSRRQECNLFLFAQAMRTPLRDSTGIALLFRYYNQLYFVERRFFSSDRSLGIYFEWFDSLTGRFRDFCLRHQRQPSCVRFLRCAILSENSRFRESVRTVQHGCCVHADRRQAGPIVGQRSGRSSGQLPQGSWNF